MFINCERFLKDVQKTQTHLKSLDQLIYSCENGNSRKTWRVMYFKYVIFA